jgi:signal transduction histidine kinase
MIRSRKRLLQLSPWILGVACLLLLLLLAFFAVNNYKREKALVHSGLEQKGATLVRFVNSYVRESRRENLRSATQWIPWKVHMQEALNLAAEQPGVEAVYIADGKGVILLHSGDDVSQGVGGQSEVSESFATALDVGPEGWVWEIFDNPDTGHKTFYLLTALKLPRNRFMMDRGHNMGGHALRSPGINAMRQEMAFLTSQQPVFIVKLDFEKFTGPLEKQFVQILIQLIVILFVGVGGTLSFYTLKGMKSLEKELQRSERLAALGKMAAGVAHELRNPLSSIKGLALLLKSYAGNNEDGIEAADTLVKEVERLNRSIGELLDFARPEQLDFSAVKLSQVLDKTINLVRLDAGALNIEIEENYAVDLAPLQADFDKLSQVVLNLLLNGVQAVGGKRGGRVRVRLEEIDGYQKISVRDNGCGIESENLKKIFDPYFTTKSEGTGLGLALSLKIIEEHDGRIELDSVVGEYTDVSVYLPRISPKGLGSYS